MLHLSIYQKVPTVLQNSPYQLCMDWLVYHGICPIKEYLSNPLLLSRLNQGDTLFLYLVNNDRALNIVLLLKEDENQCPVYYINKALRGVEERYPPIEKASFAFLVTARKLRPYFQAHTVVVLTSLPLKKMLQNIETSGWLTQWAIELGEFNIQYQPRTAARGQVLTDFLIKIENQQLKPEKHTKINPLQAEHIWTTHVDGSSNKWASSVGTVITSSTRELSGMPFCSTLKPLIMRPNTKLFWQASTLQDS